MIVEIIGIFDDDLWLLEVLVWLLLVVIDVSFDELWCCMLVFYLGYFVMIDVEVELCCGWCYLVVCWLVGLFVFYVC